VSWEHARQIDGSDVTYEDLAEEIAEIGCDGDVATLEALDRFETRPSA
jgi:hypothetical protein